MYFPICSNVFPYFLMLLLFSPSRECSDLNPWPMLRCLSGLRLPTLLPSHSSPALTSVPGPEREATVPIFGEDSNIQSLVRP